MPLNVVAEALDPRSMHVRITQLMDMIAFEERLVLQWKRQFEDKLDELNGEAGEIEEKFQYDSDKLDRHATYQALQEEIKENEEEVEYWEELESQHLAEAHGALAELAKHLEDVMKEEENAKTT